MESKLRPFLKSGRLEAGCDEAGRGCLAGPVVAAAVILPENFSHPLLDDSKKLSQKKRLIMREVILNEAIAWAISEVDPQLIDEINILNASILAMHKAIQMLAIAPEFLLIDGHRFHKYPGIGHVCEIKGDGRFASIAAASILAKTRRDDIMNDMHREFPFYGWENNKGYPTRIHRLGILEHGASPYHRMSFRLLDEQLRLQF